MSNGKDDGGSAFPVCGLSLRNDQHFMEVWHTGMSLRDYFAAAALPRMMDLLRRSSIDAKLAAATVAKASYEVADAMLSERAKSQEK